MATMQSELVEPRAVAEYLAVPMATLSNWRYRGEGPRFLKIGRHVRYRWSDIETWLAAQSRSSTRSA